LYTWSGKVGETRGDAEAFFSTLAANWLLAIRRKLNLIYGLE
jgi:hypothetical protein